MTAKTYRTKSAKITAMQLPLDDRPAYGDDNFHSAGRALAERVKEIAVWMVENGHDGNPDDEDTTDWDETDFAPNGEPLPSWGINFIEFESSDGTLNARSGDWIILDADGTFRICKPNVFEETYERADV
ncbi:hypothetical protein A4X17_11425 [Plantibacter sp. H53]|uniref:hypothetical protein n=1 Tax=Plantibacter sp. H53 TaxID=1827323 RepID=UPI0007D91577|nr:hypothetical protein [Plantibacter sp. H53]OAN35085.1 hypothetical protein A4X17_11425 [Plantibacter sp. H53]